MAAYSHNASPVRWRTTTGALQGYILLGIHWIAPGEWLKKTHANFRATSSPGGNSTVDEQAYDIGAAADYNAGLFKEKNDDIDEQGYDIGAAADYNAGLLKRKNHEIDELASLASLNTPLRSDLHAIMPLPEVQAYMPIDFNASDRNVPNEIFPAEPNVMASMASNISEQFPPTSFVNHEEIAGQIATAPLLSPSSQKESGATDG